MGLHNERMTVASTVLPPVSGSITGRLVWIAIVLGVAAVVPGMVLGLFGLPLGLGAVGVSTAALIRLMNKPSDQRRGEILTLLSLGAGVFQVVFALVAFYFVNMD